MKPNNAGMLYCHTSVAVSWMRGWVAAARRQTDGIEKLKMDFERAASMFDGAR